MGLTAMTVATLMYVITAVDLWRAGLIPHGIVYAAYAVANCALIWSTPKFRAEILGLLAPTW